MEKIALSPKEAGALVGISENDIRTLCRTGAIKATRLGNHWKIPTRYLAEWIEDLADQGEVIEVRR